MADKLNMYKGEEVVGSAERGENGKATVTIDNLKANTDYAAGTYQVTFSNENGESEKVDVPAFKTKPIAVTGVTIAPKTASVEVGKTTKVTGTIAPANATDKGMTYKSSAVAIATVSDDGTVTGVAAGEATITVTTKDGSKTDTSIITVTEPVTEPENVEVDPNENDADVSAE